MSELCLFRAQVVLGSARWVDFDRNAFIDLDTAADKRIQLPRIIRHQPDPPNSKLAENFGAQRVIAVIRFKAEVLIGFNGIVSIVLQCVRKQFVHEADTSAFLQLIHEYSMATLGDFS